MHIVHYRTKQKQMDVRGPYLCIHLPAMWVTYTYGYGASVFTAAAVMGSGIHGQTVTLPHCRARVGPQIACPIRLRMYEWEALQEFGREIKASAPTTILRTAIAVGLGLQYARQGVVNAQGYVSRPYIETLLALAGRCSPALYEYYGKPLCSYLLKIHRREGREGVRRVIQPMLDWYSPRYTDTVLHMLAVYEHAVLEEMGRCIVAA